jgi:hypothetical protein
MILLGKKENTPQVYDIYMKYLAAHSDDLKAAKIRFDTACAKRNLSESIPDEMARATKSALLINDVCRPLAGAKICYRRRRIALVYYKKFLFVAGNNARLRLLYPPELCRDSDLSLWPPDVNVFKPIDQLKSLGATDEIMHSRMMMNYDACEECVPKWA